MDAAMAVHSILFLSMNQMIYLHFLTNQTMYATIIQTIEDAYGIKKPRFLMDTITKILNIIQDVSTKTINLGKVSCNLLILISRHKKPVSYIKRNWTWISIYWSIFMWSFFFSWSFHHYIKI